MANNYKETRHKIKVTHTDRRLHSHPISVNFGGDRYYFKPGEEQMVPVAIGEHLMSIVEPLFDAKGRRIGSTPKYNVSVVTPTNKEKKAIDKVLALGDDE